MALFSLVLTSAYLTDSKTLDDDLTIGHVTVDRIHVYYEKDGTTVDASYTAVLDKHKNGVYDINITNADDITYIKNLRIDIYITSNVDTYMRLRLKDQVIRKTINYQGDVTETAIFHTPTFFNLGDNWHKEVNSINAHNTVYYYKNKVKQIGENPEKITFVIPYAQGHEYSAYPERYSLQLGIKLDLVQANFGGPQHNWNLPNPPWGGNW